MSLSVPMGVMASPTRHQALVVRYDWRLLESIIMDGSMPRQAMESLFRVIIKPGDPQEAGLLLLQMER